MLPDKNAFDFVERVEYVADSKDKKKEAESGRQKLQKTFLNLKKQNTRQISANKNMATVKINYWLVSLNNLLFYFFNYVNDFTKCNWWSKPDP